MPMVTLTCVGVGITSMYVNLGDCFLLNKMGMINNKSLPTLQDYYEKEVARQCMRKCCIIMARCQSLFPQVEVKSSLEEKEFFGKIGIIVLICNQLALPFN